MLNPYIFLRFGLFQAGEPTPAKSSEFGYSRKDVLLIAIGVIGGGYAIYNHTSA
jgi:hypothetical protein